MFDEKQKIFESIPLCIKRGPYIKYQKFPETVEKVMLILKNYEKGDIQKLVQKTGFKERTMYNWLDNIKKNPNFSPLSIQIRENARIFTEDEEDAIAHYILIEKINQCKLFTDEDCLEILVNAYLTKHQNDENIDYTVSFSRGYIYNFKKRHPFVSKVCHLKRRPSANISLINSFINEMKRIFSTISFDRIINIDETALFLNAKNMKIWHSKGQDDVSVPVGFSEKKRITAICAIGANGVKYNIQFIAKGKTELVTSTQIGDVYPHMKTYSEKGWTNDDTFYQYLNYLRSYFNDNNEIHVILDIFSAHRSETTKKLAKDLNIILHYIPAGFSDMYQPLDTTIFAVLKAYIKHMMQKSITNEDELSTKSVCQFLIKAWEKLDSNLIQESFVRLYSEEMWQCSNIFDMPLMHTCLFNRSSAIEKKRMIFNELLKMSIVDDNNVPIFSYIIDSFHDKSTNTKESIIKYVKEHITLENNDSIDQDITISISKLVSYTILKWIDTDTFMKEI